MIACFIYFYNRSHRYLNLLFLKKDRLRRRDVIFTPKHLKISPFLMHESSINPELSFTLGSNLEMLDKIDYIAIPWDDMHLLEVVDERRGKHTYQLYRLKTNDRDYRLMRIYFAEQENKFFDLLHSYGNIEIINNSYWTKPLKRVSDDKTRLILFVAIGVLFLFLKRT